MMIYSMTATFGKLSHQTLTFTPNLNIIEAPNEWGKSTWCAFIVAMFYGIDTRQQTTKTVIADKERYAPWNGEPMSGKMELSWNGRDITIERSCAGRIPFGTFRAYETESGLDIPELTAANCGQTLLGVERNVFTRSIFIRLQDMPVTNDDGLRRRLNNLVTTGDENSAADQLAQQLKDLKNKCRYHNKGLLPQAEYEREQLLQQIDQLQQLQTQIGELKAQRIQLEENIRLLDNHAVALRYAASVEAMQQLEAARQASASLQEQLEKQEQVCAALPDRTTAEAALQRGKALLQQQIQLESLRTSLSDAPQMPEIPGRFANMTPEQAIAKATEDYAAQQALEHSKKQRAKLPLIYGITAAVLLAILAVCYFVFHITSPLLFIGIGAVVALAGMIVLIYCAANAKKCAEKLQELYDKHPGITPENWICDAQHYAHTVSRYEIALQQYESQHDGYRQQQELLSQAIAAYTENSDPDSAVSDWEYILIQHQTLADTREETEKSQAHLQVLQAVTETVPQPEFADTLTLSREDTEKQLDECRFALRQTELKLGQCMGQAESIGDKTLLRARLDGVTRRIRRLEEYYKALEMAQDALYQASTILQRRFAPRISKLAQSHFHHLTGGKYQKIVLSDDLSVSASAENEDTLRSAQWRSDGTVDQLYLALRLAVAEELTPNAPLVLDDALIRFDDHRLRAALGLLQSQATTKQVILFTCQGRENQILSQ